MRSIQLEHKIMALPQSKLSAAEYLDWENHQEARHELYRGEIFAMVGVRRTHGIVSFNVAASLKQQLKGSPCQAFTESLKVQVAEDSIFYPDVFVTCDPADLNTDYIFRAPTVIVDVLSESTQAYDRGLKFALYRRLPSLMEYVLIDPDTHRVEVFRRGTDGLFTLHDYTDTPRFPLTSIRCELQMEEIFEGMEGKPS
jgi:Uma2 family endonuclease